MHIVVVIDMMEEDSGVRDKGSTYKSVSEFSNSDTIEFNEEFI